MSEGIATAAALIRAAIELETQARRLRQDALRIRAAERDPEHLLKRMERLEHAALATSRDSEAMETEAARLGVPPRLLAAIAKRARAKKETHIKRVRDREIARLARSGRSNREIAERFGISTRTVARALAAARRDD